MDRARQAQARCLTWQQKCAAHAGIADQLARRSMTLLVTSAAGASGDGFGQLLAFADDGKPLWRSLLAQSSRIDSSLEEANSTRRSWT